MKKVLTLAMGVIIALLCVSCQDDEVISLQEEQIIQTVNGSATEKRRTTSAKFSLFDEYYAVSLSNYHHVKQQSYGKCEVTAYVVARKMKNPSYPNAYSNINTIYNTYSSGGVSLGELYYYNNGTSKSLLSKPAGNNQWGNGRDALKTFIKNSLSNNKPVLLPTEYGMNNGSVGHFYIIVELYWKDGGTGSIVGVKDIYVSDSSTQYYDYTDLLDSNWRNFDSRPGYRTYNAIAFNGNNEYHSTRILLMRVFLYVI